MDTEHTEAEPMHKEHSPPARLSIPQLVKLSVYWFGLQFFWTSTQLIVLPGKVRELVPLESLGAYLSLIKGTGAIVVILTQLTVGFISDHAYSKLGRRRPFLIYGTVSGCAAIAFFILAPGYWWLLAAYLLIEATINVASVPFQSLLPDLVPKEQHAQAGSVMGLLHLAGNLVGLISLLAMVLIFGDSTEAGYRMFLLPAYLILLIGTMLIVVFGIDEKGWAQVPRKAVAGAVRIIKILPGTIIKFAKTAPTLFGCMVSDYRKVDLRAQPNFVWLALSRFTVFLGYHSFLTFVKYYVEVNLDRESWLADIGISQDRIGDYLGLVTPAMLVFFILGGLAGNLLAAPLAERFGKKSVIAGGMILACIMDIPMIFTTNVWVAIIAGSFLGIGWGAFIAADWAFACSLMPKDRAGSFMGIWDVSTLLPQILAPVIAGGLIRDIVFNANVARLGEQAAEALAHRAILASIIVFFVAGIYLLKFVREINPRPQHRSRE